MHALSIPPIHRLAHLAPVILRVTVGGIMALHGWEKLVDMGPATFGQSMIADLGLPALELLGWAVTLTELIGGILLILGLVTRVSASLLIVVLVGATVLVKPDLGVIAPMGAMLPGAELDLP